MRVLFFCAALLCAVSLYAQTTLNGRVIDSESGADVPFAGITYNDEDFGVTGDASGRFSIRSSQTIVRLNIRAFGYDSKVVNVPAGAAEITVRLTPSNTVLAEVEVEAGENPLHRIIRNVIANRDRNDPESLDAFSYETYSKFLFTVVGDTAGPLIDTVFMPLDEANPDMGVNRDSIVRIDSSNFYLKEFMDTQHLFLMESVTERTYASPRDNEKVLASRISGLQTPLFVLLSNEMQSFSFYDNYISIMGSERVNPVAPGAIGRYVYLPLDTTYQGSDTTFIIKYYPVKGHRFKGLDGELSITTDGWAVRRVIARPTGQDILGVVTGDRTVFGVEIHQTYSKIADHWFPRELSMDFKDFTQEEDGTSSAVGMETGDGSLVGFGRTRLQNIRINPEIDRSDVPRITVQIEEDAAEKDETFWLQYRGDSLDAREVRTYEVMDSIGEELNIEQKIKWLMAFTTGKVRWGYFDFLIDKLLRYNTYEGFRLGLGLQTSPKLSERFSVGGHVAYGFGDKVWKYGYFGEIYLDKTTEATLYGGYDFDIHEAATTRYSLQRRTIFGSQDYRILNIPVFDQVSDVYGGFRYRIWPNLRADISFHRQNRVNTADYGFRYTTEDEDLLIAGYNVAFAKLELEYAPHDEYIAGPFGLRALEITYPRFRFSYEEGFDNLFDRNFPFRRVDAQAIHQIRRVYLGTTTLFFGGSYLQGDVPYGMLAGPEANGVGDGLTWETFTGAFGSYRSFETMPFNRFAANGYVVMDIRHSFEDRLFNIGTWAPTVAVVYRTTFGVLDHPESHIGFDLEATDKGYHEAGVEINQMYNGLGLGFYQRFGPYYSGDYSNNIGLKLTYRTTLF